MQTPKNILAISCSTEIASFACYHNKQMTYQQNHGEKPHSQIIISTLKKLLPGQSIKNIEGIAVDIGPGSFIGIRTAIATAQAIAMSQQLPILAINSLELLALQASTENQQKTIATAIDARRQQWYYAEWQTEKPYHLKNIKAPQLLDPNNQPFDKTYYLTGTGFFSQNLYGAKINQQNIDKNPNHPNAKTLIKTALENPNYPWQHYSKLKPFYLRDHIAEPTIQP